MDGLLHRQVTGTNPATDRVKRLYVTFVAIGFVITVSQPYYRKSLICIPTTIYMPYGDSVILAPGHRSHRNSK